MNLKKTLSRDAIALELKSDAKEALIEELLDLLMATGRIRDLKARKEALKAVLDREKRMSTGMQNGVAIPHGKTDVVDSLVAAFGIKREGINFGSLDGKPSNIFVITLSPDTRTGPHIQFLAEICRQLDDARVRERILAAQSKDEVFDILSEKES